MLVRRYIISELKVKFLGRKNKNRMIGIVIVIAILGIGIFFLGGNLFTIFQPGVAGDIVEVEAGTIISNKASSLQCSDSSRNSVLTSKTITRSDGRAISGFEVDLSIERITSGGESSGQKPFCDANYNPTISVDVLCNKDGGISTVGTYTGIITKRQALNLDCSFLTANFLLREADKFVGSTMTTKGSATFNLIPFSQVVVGEEFTISTKQILDCPDNVDFCQYKTSGGCSKVQVETLGKTTSDNCASVSSEFLLECEGVIPTGVSSLICSKNDWLDNNCPDNQIGFCAASSEPKAVLSLIGNVCNNNGVCELGEGCSSCASDCFVGVGQVCCANQVTEVCTSDSQCFDNKLWTIDTCSLAGTCGAVCQNVVNLDFCGISDSCTSFNVNPITGQCTETEIGACQAGEIETRACGNCGTQTRSCSSSCGWNAWSTCVNQGVCSEGQFQSCSLGGIPGQQQCSSSCQYDACTATGECIPGSTEACGECGQKMCDSTGNFGICVQQTEMCSTGFQCVPA